MQVIYSLFALESFNICSNWLVCLSTCVTFVYVSFYIAFAKWKWYKHVWDNRNSTFQYFKLISNRRSPSSKSNKWTITISVYFFNIWRKYSWAKKSEKLCNQNFVHQFHLRWLVPQVWENLLIIPKIRSHVKYMHFCELNMKTRKSLRVVCLSAPFLVVYCLYCNPNVLYLHDSTQCYKKKGM